MVNDSPGVYFNHLPIFKMAAIPTLKPRRETCGGGYKCRRARRGMSSLIYLMDKLPYLVIYCIWYDNTVYGGVYGVNTNSNV